MLAPSTSWKLFFLGSLLLSHSLFFLHVLALLLLLGTLFLVHFLLLGFFSSFFLVFLLLELGLLGCCLFLGNTLFHLLFSSLLPFLASSRNHVAVIAAYSVSVAPSCPVAKDTNRGYLVIP